MGSLSTLHLKDVLLVSAVLAMFFLAAPQVFTQQSSKAMKAKELCFRGEKRTEETINQCSKRVLDGENEKRGPNGEKAKVTARTCFVNQGSDFCIRK